MVVKYQGASWFRQRIICSTLSGKTLSIKDIRVNSACPGLRGYESTLLKLIDKISNGCIIDIDVTGTCLYYKPGILIGGKFELDCGTERGIGYYMELLVCLALFAKNPLKVLLKGVTNHNNGLDLSIHTFQHVVLPNLKHFGPESLEVKIIKCGAPPTGGGIVEFSSSPLKQLKTIELVEDGKIKRIRGVAYSIKISNQVSSRVIQTAREILNKYSPDVYIYADLNTGSGNHSAGKTPIDQSPGYGLTLIAESTTGCLISYEMMAKPKQVPEELAKEATTQFLLETLRRGCVDSSNQSILLLLMAAGPADVSRIRTGKLTPYTIEFMRHIRAFFGIKFKIEPDVETKTVVLTCLGSGNQNWARKAF